MNHILASVPNPSNQKPPNRNDNLKNTPIVIKPNQKTNFNQTKLNQVSSIQINQNPIGHIAVQYFNAPMVQTISHKNIPSTIQKINLNPQPQMQFQQPQQIQNIQQTQFNQPFQQIQQIQPIPRQDNNIYYQKQQIIQPPQQPIKQPDPPTPDEQVFKCLLKNYKKNILLSLSKSYTVRPEVSGPKTRQSSKSKSENRNQAAQKENNLSNSKSEKKHIKSLETQDEKLTFDQTFLENYFFDKYHEETKISRLSRRQTTAPFCPKYETWEKVGHGYLVNPNPPYYYEEPHFVDFICQCKLKALAIGGEGGSVYASKDEQAPLLASNARLQFSMIIDEHGIEQLKVEAKMRNASCRNPKPGTIDKLAKFCNQLEVKIREYNDDVRNKYRMPPIVPYDVNEIISERNRIEKEENGDKAKVSKYYIIPDFCRFPLDQLHFLSYALRMIELNSILTPKHSLHITKAFTLVFPLIMKAVVRPEKEWHFIGKRIHYTYFFRLFHLLNRLTEYFSTIPMIPCHASFGIINSLRSDLTATWQKELHKISENIEFGGCLSWLLCEMRDISLALTIHLNDVNMVKDTIKLFDKYESHHPERFPHSNNYMRNYFGKNNNVKGNNAKNNSNLSYYRNRINIKYGKRGNSSDNSNSSNTGGATVGKRTNFRKMSGTRFIYNDDNMKSFNFEKKFVYDKNDKYDFTVDDLLKIACRENNDQKIYMMKFVVDDDGFLSFIVKQPDEEQVQKISDFYNCLTSVPPFYPFIITAQKSKQKQDEEETPLYLTSDVNFRFDAAYPSTEKFGKPLRIHFEPHSQQSFFSLNISNFY